MNTRTPKFIEIITAKTNMLRYLLTENGLSLAAVALATNINIQSLQAFMRLEASLSAEEAEALARYFRLKPSAFVA